MSGELGGRLVALVAGCAVCAALVAGWLGWFAGAASAGSSCTADSPYSQAVAGTGGLVGYWRLGDSGGSVACDTLGSDPGAYSGAVALGQPGALASDAGTSVAFDGVSGEMSVAADSALEVGDSFSVEAWVKRSSPGSSGDQTVFSDGGSWSVAFDSRDHLVLLDGSTPIASSAATVSSTSAWHYVAVTKSGATVHLYLDGKDVTGNIANQTLAAVNGPLQIAADGSSGFLDGSIQEVALYTQALTTTEVGSHYATGVLPDLSAPSISGITTDGQTLSAQTGSWGGSPTSYAYQWKTCDTQGACSDIAGATNSTLVLASSDVGQMIEVQVTVSNGAVSDAATSTPTAMVVAAAPSNTSAPSISGTAKEGQTLTASSGAWSGTAPISYAYRWERCDASGANCVVISGATAASYQATSADVGATVRARVTASNPGGSSTATSAPSAAVGAGGLLERPMTGGTAPTNTAAPTISGAAAYGQTLTASPGTWSGTAPISYAYQWQRCNSSGGSCANISGATSTTYQAAAADVGDTVLVKVTATNSAGSASANSAISSVVTAVAPSNTSSPTISGRLTAGQTVTASSGTWSGDTPITYRYHWQRCNSSGGSCVNISGATSQTYQLVSADVSSTVKAVVMATNPGGSVNASSAASGVVVAALPPTITSVSHSNQPSGPVWNGSDQITVTATSNGAGVQEFEITDAQGVVASQSNACNGSPSSPCPLSSTQTLTVSVGSLALGEVQLQLIAIDASGAQSSPTSWTVDSVVASSCSDNWTGGTSGNWSTAADWSTGAEPGEHDYACTPTGSGVTVDPFASGVGRIAASGSVTVAANAALSLADGSDPSTVADLSLGANSGLAGAGELDVSNSLSLTSSSSSSANLDGGSLVLLSGATGSITGSTPASLVSTLVNQGTLTINGSGLSGGVSAELENTVGATLNINPDGSGSGLSGPSEAALINDGAIVASGSGTSTIGWAIANSGSVLVSSGTLVLTGGTTSASPASGSWQATGSGALQLGTNSYQSFTFGSAALSGNVGIDAYVTAADLQGNAASVTFTSGSLILNGPTVSTLGSLTMTGSSSLAGSGELDVSSALALSGSDTPELEGGTLVILPTATGTVDGGVYLAETLRNEGTLTISSGSLWGLGGAPSLAGALDNATGATIYLNAEGGSYYGLPGNWTTPLVNDGSIIKDAGSGTSTIGYAIENNGTITAQSGTIDVENGSVSGTAASGSWGATGGGVVEFSAGYGESYTLGSATFSGDVEVAAPVTAADVQGPSASVTVPSGSLTVNGPDVSNLGTLELDGTGSIDGSGEIDVSGSFAITGSDDPLAGGTLVILPGATATIDGSGTLQQTLRNEGTMTISSGGLYGTSGAELDNSHGATIYLNAEGTISGLSGSTQASLINDGSIEKDAGAGTSLIAYAADNEGTVSAQTGEIDLEGGSLPWYEDLETLPTLESSSLDDPSQCPTPPVAQQGAWSTSSSGSIALGGGCYTLGGASMLTGNIEIDSTVQIGAVQSDASITDDGVLDVQSEPFVTEAAQVGGLQLNGEVTGPGELDVCSSFDWQSGSIDGPGATVLCDGATGQIDGGTGSPVQIGAGALVNHGTLTWNSGSILTASPAVLWNAGTFDANSETGTLSSTGTILYNTGTIQKTAGTGTTEIDALLLNEAGAPAASSGTLLFAGENLSSTPPSSSGQSAQCSQSGGTVLTGWVNLADNPFQVVAGDTGADCVAGGTASGSAQLVAEPDVGGSGWSTVATGTCSSASVCNITAGAAIPQGDSQYYEQADGETYALEAQYAYSPDPPLGTGAWTEELDLPPGTSTTSPLPASSESGGSNPASPNRNVSTCGDPVVCSTGDQTEQQTDLAVAGTGGGMALARTYNSQLASTQTQPSAFGYGWTGPFDVHLTRDSADATATVQNANGSTAAFTINDDGTFTAPASVQATLVQDANGDYSYVLPSQETLVFSSSGDILSETDRAGLTTSFTYNGQGQVSAMTAPSGRQFTFGYNSQGLVSSATDPAGLTISYSYDSTEDLTEVTDNSGVSAWRWKFGYDDQHELTSMTDADNNQTTITYTDGKVSSQTDPMGRITSWSYAPGETDISLPGGSVTRELFDANGDPISITRGFGSSSQTTQAWTYNDMLEPVTRTVGSRSETTSYGYDAAGNMTSETDPDGNTTHWTYDAQRDVTSMKLPSGLQTTYGYTAGEPTSISRPAPSGTQTTTMTYQGGNLASSTDPRGKQTIYGYNAEGDLTSEADPLDNQTTWTYDADGRPSTEVTPRGNVLDGDPADYTTTYTYDLLGRLTKVVVPGGNTTQYGYDADGNQTSVEDPDQNTTTTTYDADGEPTQVQQPDQSTEQTTYYDTGQVHTQKDGAGNTTTYVYNALGELTSTTLPDTSRQTTYSYSAAGDLTSETNPAGDKTSFGHNDDGQVTAIHYARDATPAASFAYTPDGLLSSMTDATGTSSLSYDSLDRLTSQTNGDGQTVRYAYDLANNQTSITYPDGNQLTQTFNDDEQLGSITDWNGNTTQFAYDPDGNLSTTTLPTSTGEIDTDTYTHDDQLQSQQFAQGTSNLATLGYQYDADSNVTQETQTGLPGPASTTYTYTTLDQLQTAGSDSYVYNNAQDPTTIDGNSGYGYNSTDELTSSPTAAYTYNQLGDRTSQSTTQGATSYSYDTAGRLTQVDPPNGSTVSYAYDGNGQLASETSNNTTSQFAWDNTGDVPLLLTDGHNDYIYGPDDLPIEQVAANTTTYLHHDQIGSTRLITTSTGQTAATSTYNPYGALQASTGTATSPLGYVGQYTDPGTGLEYDQARFYDPTTGQFLSPDPLKAVTGQPYAYADNSPTNYADPTGLLFGVSLDDVGNFVAGFGDTLTFGGTAAIRQLIGDDNVNYCSAAYGEGSVGAIAATALIPGEGEAVELGEAKAAAGGLPAIAGGSGPISMDQAIEYATQHAGDDGVLEETGSGLNYQFRGTSTKANGDLEQRIGRLDVNPLDAHVANNGPHLNLETQINGIVVSNIHVPIDPTTIRPGDVP